MSTPMPPDAQQHPLDGSGVLAQILIAQGDIQRQLAVLSERMSVLPDHESRLRQLERLAARAIGWAIGSGVLTGGGVGSLVAYFTHK